MKRFSLLICALLLGTVGARTQSQGIGVGVILGEPIGGSFKAWLSDKTAVDAGIGYANWSHAWFQSPSDYLLHSFDLLRAGSRRLPVYYVLGGRIKFADDTQFGIRAPIGVSYLLDGAPVDLFGEVAPILDVTPGIRLEWSFAVGARYWF